MQYNMYSVYSTIYIYTVQYVYNTICMQYNIAICIQYTMYAVQYVYNTICMQYKMYSV